LERTANATEKTAKQGGLRWTELKSQIDLAAGALRTVAKVGQQVFEFGREGAQITQTTQSFELMNDEIFRTPELMERMRDASRGTISDVQLMQGVLKLTAGASDELGQAFAGAAPKLLEIAKASNKLNPSLGDTAFLYDSISTGIKRASPLILDNLGIVVNVGEANKNYAEQLGKTVAALTAEEKQMALLNATLEAGDQLINQVGGNVDSAADSYARLEVEVENATNKLKEFASTKLIPVVEGLEPAVEAITNEYGAAVTSIIDDNLALAGSMSQLQSEASRLQEAADVGGGLGAFLSGTSKELAAGRVEVAGAMERLSVDADEFSQNIEQAFGVESARVVESLAVSLGAPTEVLYQGIEAQFQWIRNQRIANTVAADADVKFRFYAEAIAAAAKEQAKLVEGADRKLTGPTDEEIASVEAYKESIEAAIQAEEDLEHALRTTLRAGVADEFASSMEDAFARATASAARDVEDLAKSFRIATSFTEAIGGNELQFFNEDLEELGPKLVTIGGRTADQNRILGEAKDRYKQLDRAIVDYQIGLDGLGLSESERAEKVADLVAQQQELIPLMDELGNVTGSAQMATKEATINEEALSQALFDSVAAIAAQNEAFGVTATDLALMAGALGIYNEEQLQAALKTAILTEKVQELAKAVADPDQLFSIGRALAELKELASELETTDLDLAPAFDTTRPEGDLDRLATKLDDLEMRGDISTDAAEEQIPVDLLVATLTPGASEGSLPEAVAVDITTTAPEATDETQNFIDKMNEIERDISVNINVKVNQSGDDINVPGGIPGIDSFNATGGRFIVPPGFNEQTNPFIVAVESGEEVIVRTASDRQRADSVSQQGQGDTGGSVSQDTYIINNNTREAAALTMAMVDERARKRRNQYMGVG
jgi:hypothetical protein